jgi:hypothetical protein
MAIALPGLEFSAGDTLAGELRIHPHKNFEASEVRLELRKTELVPYDQGNQSQKVFPVKLAGKSRFQAGQAQVFPFQVPILPAIVPSVQGPFGAISWTLVAVLARSLRSDTRLEQEFYIFSGRR